MRAIRAFTAVRAIRDLRAIRAFTAIGAVNAFRALRAIRAFMANRAVRAIRAIRASMLKSGVSDRKAQSRLLYNTIQRIPFSGSHPAEFEILSVERRNDPIKPRINSCLRLVFRLEGYDPT